LTYPWVAGATGWALVFAGVAAIDLTIAARFSPKPENIETADPDAPPTPSWARFPALLRELSWVLYAVAFGLAGGYGTAGLVEARTLAPALAAATVVVLIAGIGLAGGLALHRGPLPDLSAGLATLAVIVAITRVGAVALPGYQLIFSAGAVALTALV